MTAQSIDTGTTDLLAELDAGVLTLTLNRPEARNAMSAAMMPAIRDQLASAELNPEVRCIVLTGAGKAFCAGGDFSQMSGNSDVPELAPKGDYADLLLAMVNAEKPIVARVNGHAMGGGLGLVAASHFAVGAIGAKLGTPEINVGLFPMMIMAVMRRLMPRRQLVKMMLFGERFGAERAAELGLLNRAVPADGLDGAVADITAQIASKSPITVKLGLEAIAAQKGPSHASRNAMIVTSYVKINQLRTSHGHDSILAKGHLKLG